MAVKTISGSSIVLSLDLSTGTTPVAIMGATTGTLNVNQETIDVTNKDSSGLKEYINGVKSWSVDCEAFTTGNGTAVNKDGIIAQLVAGTSIFIQFRDGSGQSASKKYTGRGFITSVSETANVGEFGTYSVSIQGTGALSVASA